MSLSVKNLNFSHQLQRGYMHHLRSLKVASNRLSSGLRVNGASDDVAGLSISSRLQSRIQGLTSAMRNNEDGMSFTEVAEGALSEMENTVQKMREIAVYASTDTLTNRERQTLQEELEGLSQTVQKISDGAFFNNRKIFDGNQTQTTFQVGETADQTLSVYMRKIDSTTLGQQSIVIGSSGVSTDKDLTDNDNDFFLLNGVFVRNSLASDDSVSMTDRANSAIAKAAAINSVSSETRVRAFVLETRTDNQDTLNTEIGAGTTFGNTGAVQEVELTSNTYMVINGVAVSGFKVEDNDASGTLRQAINSVYDQTGVKAEMNSDGELVLIAPDGRNLFVEYIDDDGATLESLIGLSDGDLFAYGGQIMLQSAEGMDLDFGFEVNNSLGDVVGNYSHTLEYYQGVNSEYSIQNLDVSTSFGRQMALTTLDEALGQISAERSFLGGLSNRFEATLNNLSQVQYNLQSTQSQVEDADFADETLRLISSQIKLGSTISLFERANASGIAALTLLQSQTSLRPSSSISGLRSIESTGFSIL